MNPFYDSLIGKFIVTAEDRDDLIQRGKRVLEEAEIDGIATTIPFHKDILTDETFINNQHTTKYLEERSQGNGVEETE